MPRTRSGRHRRLLVALAVVAMLALVAVAGAGLSASRPSPAEAKIVASVEYQPGYRLDVWSTAVSGRAAAPAVVMVHSCCGDRADLGKLARALAGAGAVVFNVDWGGIGERARFPESYEHIACAYAYAQNHARDHGADRARTALLGWGDGAMAAAVVAAEPGRFASPRCAHATPRTRPASVVGVAGYYGWTWPPPPDVVNPRSIAFFGGDPTGSAQPGWRVASAFAHLDDGPPTTLLVGERDNLCPGTLRYAAGLAEHQRDIRVVVAPYAADQSMISPRTLEGQLTVRETLAALRASPRPWTSDPLRRPRSDSGDRVEGRCAS